MSPEDKATLDKEAERLKYYYEGASEQVKIDFRRRYDRACAIIVRCRAIWKKLDEAKQELAKTRGDKWRPIFIGFLIAGGFLYLWLSPGQGFADTLGTAAALYAAGYFVVLKWNEHRLNNEINWLEMREADFLCEWQTTGAFAAEFWGERDCDREGIRLILPGSLLSESEKAKLEEELRLSSYVLKHKTRLGIFHSASGTRENRQLGIDGDGLKFELERHDW
jgi:hypothetical protein